jgi:hypothetical protein
MLTIQSVFCVYTSFSEYVLGWFSPVLFIATYGEQMYTLGPNASQTHVLFCDFFKQLIWKSFRIITEVSCGTVALYGLFINFFFLADSYK